MKRLYPFILLFILTGLFSLSLFSSDDLPLYKISGQDIGKRVSVSGLVINAIPVRNGTIVILYNYSSIKVPVFHEMRILPGDLLSVDGKIARYRREIEILPEDIELRYPEILNMNIEDITDITVHRTIKTIGEITEKKKNSFKLADNNEYIHVFANTGIEENAIVEVEGLVERYRSVLYIRPRNITRLA